MVKRYRYTHIPDVSGIYCLENMYNNHVYVGQSKSIRARARSHFRLLRANKHPNQYLQNAYNKYGEGTFFFRVLDIVKYDKLDEAEWYWIMKLKPEYNIVTKPEHLKNIVGAKKEKEENSKPAKIDLRTLEMIYPFNYADDNRPDWHGWVYGGQPKPD